MRLTIRKRGFMPPFNKGGQGGIYALQKIPLHPPLTKRGSLIAVSIIFANLLLSACAVGPNYKRPATVVDEQAKVVNKQAGIVDKQTDAVSDTQSVGETPKPANETYKEAQTGAWKIAEPNDQNARGNWWDIFEDEQLNALQNQLISANQNIAAAEARYRQARAVAQAARSAYFPNLSLNVAQTRSGGSTVNQLSTQSAIGTQNIATLDASWELDVWGRIRRQVEAGEASAQASAGDYAAAILSAQAELAQNYWLLRISDAQQQLLDRTVGDYEKSLQLTKNQYNAGVAGRAEVTQAQAQFKAAQAQAVDNGITRGQLEHAIAILIGKAPIDVAIEQAQIANSNSELSKPLPAIPLLLPSSLLERRPDIAAAERRVIAANANIGVARAAYFPVVGISASGGYRSKSFSDWFTAPNRFWSIGPSLSLPLFDGGLRSAQTRQAEAVYDETVATYRQTVLAGLQEVEDNLIALDHLAKEVQFQSDAVAASREALQLVNNQYKAGTVSFLNVLTAETTAFNNERTLLQAQGRQYTASVLLIKALGGGWDADNLHGAEN
jgi:NodT family efflux transporter outer membrane factor (OMF) lipoprotein